MARETCGSKPTKKITEIDHATGTRIYDRYVCMTDIFDTHICVCVCVCVCVIFIEEGRKKEAQRQTNIYIERRGETETRQDMERGGKALV